MSAKLRRRHGGERGVGVGSICRDVIDKIVLKAPEVRSPMRMPIFNRTQFRTQSPVSGLAEIAGILMAVGDFEMVRAAGFEPATPSV